MVRKADLDAFVGTLVRNVDPLLGADPGLCPVPAAARAACRRLADVVRLLADGRLNRVGFRNGAATYAGILIDPVEIRSLSPDPPRDVLSVSQASAETGLPPHVLRSLGRLGILPTASADAAPGAAPGLKIAAADLSLFRTRYVSLAELADRQGTTPRLLWNRLGEAGVKTAVDHRLAGAAIYRRQDVPDVSKLDLVPWPAGKRR